VKASTGVRFALENNVIPMGLHAEHADIVLEQTGNNSFPKLLNGASITLRGICTAIEREAVLKR